MAKKYSGSQCQRKLFGYQCYSKYHLFSFPLLWQYLALIIWAIGTVTSVIFHLGTKEEGVQPQESEETGKSQPSIPSSYQISGPLLLWKHWLVEPAFYQVISWRSEQHTHRHKKLYYVHYKQVKIYLIMKYFTVCCWITIRVYFCFPISGCSTIYVHKTDCKFVPNIHPNVSDKLLITSKGEKRDTYQYKIKVFFGWIIIIQ